MIEKLEIYNLQNEYIGLQDRKEFYQEIRDEFKNTSKITKQVKTIRVLLLNSSGRIYLQKRSKIKKENPGLYDKTVGGHVQAGDSWELTVVKESAEELGFPASILSDIDFDRAIKTADLSIVGVFKEIDYIENFESTRVIEGKKNIIQPQITRMYIGYYDGAIRFVDGESSGIEVFSLEELENEFQSNPYKFTEDTKYMIDKYKRFLQAIKK